MDPQPTPFPGKNQPLKPNPNQKVAKPSQPTAREHVTYREKRAFGTVRNSNIPTRTVFEKLAVVKPSIAVPRKQHQMTRPVQVPVVTKAAKNENSLENLKPKSNQERVLIREECGEKNPIQKLWTPVTTTASPSLSQRKITFRVPSINEAATKENLHGNPNTKSNHKTDSLLEVGEKTPIQTPLTQTAFPTLSDRKIYAGSAYQSAKICSKCRFDKLETSTYWLAQIKLSESVEKHFVSAAFFRLAFESKEEPAGKLRLELELFGAKRAVSGTNSVEGLVSYLWSVRSMRRTWNTILSNFQSGKIRERTSCIG